MASLESCEACPRQCRVDRLSGRTGTCRIGRYARGNRYFAHFGEEDCLRGWNGSGTIFFSGCNLRCVFCQNYEISQVAAGAEVPPERLAAMMLELQARGCHNINWVTPEHVVPQVLEALPSAIEGGLRLPIVYNTSAYDSLESLRLMDGIVSIYLPDFKYASTEPSRRYLGAPDYPEAARAALREMHRQVGDLEIDSNGLALRGILLRHLVMPGAQAEQNRIFRFLADSISPDTYVNLMDQYHPDARVGRDRFPELNRRITPREYRTAHHAAIAAGLHRFD